MHKLIPVLKPGVHFITISTAQWAVLVGTLRELATPASSEQEEERRRRQVWQGTEPKPAVRYGLVEEKNWVFDGGLVTDGYTARMRMRRRTGVWGLCA